MRARCAPVSSPTRLSKETYHTPARLVPSDSSAAPVDSPAIKVLIVAAGL
jgi:hypothetical protein